MVFLAALLVPGLLAASDFSGKLKTDARVGLTNGNFTWLEETAALNWEKALSDSISGKVGLLFRYNPYAVPTNNAGELTNLLAPLSMELDEAYVKYDDFIFNKLDLTVGKQRIAWGAADKLNPTDNLNPNDFYDTMDFGKKIASFAFLATYHLPVLESGIDLVYSPLASVARLNGMHVELTSYALSTNLFGDIAEKVTVFSNATSGWSTENVVQPDLNASNFTAGARWFCTVGGFDINISYVTRLNDQPIVKKVTTAQTVTLTNEYTTGVTTTNTVLNSCSYEEGYYREHIFGFDVVKDWDFLMTWVEVALTLPGEQKVSVESSLDTAVEVLYMGAHYTNYNATNGQVSTETLLSNKPYVKYTVGMDKSFDGGWYVNLQYNHGFFTERGNSGLTRLQDYLMLRIEKTFLNDQLKFSLTGMGNVNRVEDLFAASDWTGFLTDNAGYLAMAAMNYTPVPGFSIELGVIGIDGADNCTLGQLKDNDLVYTEAGCQF